MDGMLVVVNWLNIMLVVELMVKIVVGLVLGAMVVLVLTLWLVVALMRIVVISVTIGLLFLVMDGGSVMLRFMNNGLMVSGLGMENFMVHWLAWGFMMSDSWVDFLVMWSLMCVMATIVMLGAVLMRFMDGYMLVQLVDALMQMNWLVLDVMVLHDFLSRVIILSVTDVVISVGVKHILDTVLFLVFTLSMSFRNKGLRLCDLFGFVLFWFVLFIRFWLSFFCIRLRI